MGDVPGPASAPTIGCPSLEPGPVPEGPGRASRDCGVGVRNHGPGAQPLPRPGSRVLCTDRTGDTARGPARSSNRVTRVVRELRSPQRLLRVLPVHFLDHFSKFLPAGVAGREGGGRVRCCWGGRWRRLLPMGRGGEGVGLTWRVSAARSPPSPHVRPRLMAPLQEQQQPLGMGFLAPGDLEAVKRVPGRTRTCSCWAGCPEPPHRRTLAGVLETPSRPSPGASSSCLRPALSSSGRLAERIPAAAPCWRAMNNACFPANPPTCNRPTIVPIAGSPAGCTRRATRVHTKGGDVRWEVATLNLVVHLGYSLPRDRPLGSRGCRQSRVPRGDRDTSPRLPHRCSRRLGHGRAPGAGHGAPGVTPGAGRRGRC